MVMEAPEVVGMLSLATCEMDGASYVNDSASVPARLPTVKLVVIRRPEPEAEWQISCVTDVQEVVPHEDIPSLTVGV